MKNFYNQKKRVFKAKAKREEAGSKMEVMGKEQLKSEQRISFLATSCRTKTSR
jgi:hypothetical protein